ncbi:MAG: hypothetical protein OCD02_22685 [Spirochaetaceae bacterium]
MKYIIKQFFLLFLVISIMSCDVVSEFLTTNYFDDLSDTDETDIDIDENSVWISISDADKLTKIDEYTSYALSEDFSGQLFQSLKTNETYKNGVSDYYRQLLVDQPIRMYISDDGYDDYIDDLAIYQNRALALAKIEAYTTDKLMIAGFNELLIDYSSGIREGVLNHKLIFSEMFSVPDTLWATDGDDADTVNSELSSFKRAGSALSLLGETITDRDNPLIDSVTEDDAIFILLACMVNNVIEETMTDSSTTETVSLQSLTSQTVTRDTTDAIIQFPEDITGGTTLENYLGADGALLYAASGYELPEISIFGGNL